MQTPNSVLSISAKTPRHATFLALAPPAAAIGYPFLLVLFHLSMTRPGGPAVLSALLLLSAVAAPFTGLYALWTLDSLTDPSPVEVRAKILALVSVAAPPLYTALGVVLTMLHNPVSDLVTWVVLWAVITAIALAPRHAASPPAITRPRVLPRLRFAHGVSAATIVLIFLAMHLFNHLAGLWSEALHRTLMNDFRHIYRARLVEPVLVALLLFQIASGPLLAWQYAKDRVDAWRTLQIASGAYLFFYLLAHMNSVFIYARAYAHIPTDWDFATGAPAGLLRDAWNIRLFPHYLLGVFFVLTHLVLGARIVALAHYVRLRTANRLAVVGIALAAGVAVAIMAGMSGFHIGQ